MIRYYEITEQEMIDIKAQLPANIAFGFTSYGGHYFDSKTVEAIDNEHGNILDLIFQQLFSKDKQTFLDEKESDTYETYILQKEKNAKGFDVYEKIIGQIRSQGDLGTTFDASIIPGYKLLTDVRMMLKDGLHEAAFRYFMTDIKPLGLLTPETTSFVENIMQELLKEYGTPQPIIDAIMTVPKGNL